jgi:voltage-gated potassium channel
MLQPAPSLHSSRARLARRLRRWLEKPMLVLSFAWVALVVVQMVNPNLPYVSQLGDVIWGIFIVDFGARLLIAPDKLNFLKGNWLIAVSLILPALRTFRIFWVLRLSTGARFIRLMSAVNRSMRALVASLGHRGFGYVVLLTVIVTLVGAAGMFAFERAPNGAPYFHGYSDALWWTAMIMTTMGSAYWPQTGDGRLLCLGLAIYAFAVFGYVTATIATFFIDTAPKKPAVATGDQVQALQDELRALRADLQRRPDAGNTVSATPARERGAG